MNTQLLLMIPLTLAMSACMGTETSQTITRFESYSDGAQTAIQRNMSLSIAPTNSIPLSGSAVYEGVAAYSRASETASAIITNPDLVSDVRLNVEFGAPASSAITGSASNFTAPNGQGVSGSLAIQNGTLSGSALTADISGRITQSGTAQTYNGGLIARLSGNGADRLAGAAALKATSGSELFAAFAADATSATRTPQVVSGTTTVTTTTVPFPSTFRTYPRVRLSNFEPVNIYTPPSRRSSSTCYTGPRGGTYTLTASGNKNYSGC